MKKSDEVSISTSCLNRAADDEPIFTLRANDPTAPGVVRSWAARYKWRKQVAGEWDNRARAKYTEAMTLAREMEEWKR